MITIKNLPFIIILSSLLFSCGKETQDLFINKSDIIIGGYDNRTLLNQVDTSIVSINNEEERSVCSGTVIGPKHIITAAHCVFNKDENNFYTKRTVIPGINRTNLEKPIQRFFMKNVYVPHKYIELAKINNQSSELFAYDVAIIEIKNTKDNASFMSQTTSAQITSFSESNFNENLTNIAYHGDLNYETPYKQENCHIVDKFIHGILTHTCDIYRGSSGSSLQVNNQIIAIASGELPRDFNVGTQLTQSIVNSISSVLSNNDQSFFTRQEIDQKPFIGIDIVNNCLEDVYVALQYQDLSGDWVFKGHYKISANELFITPIQSKSINIYYHAQTKNKSFTWEGDHKATNSKGNQFNMRKVEAENRFYDHRINFNCN